MSGLAHDAEAFEVALVQFVSLAQRMIDAENAKHFPRNSRQVLTISRRPKQPIRLLISNWTRLVWAFIDPETGDILKPITWDLYRRNPRGNIFNANPLDGVNASGPMPARE
ncbi:hypothetical protein LZC95_07820 [Pendulispora brunnea]|uniref:Uncharacterized protein n=1 Tax=Pendulispora brunnea TaxID=2905690 RepID=A0ABZ2KGS0_9BACT